MNTAVIAALSAGLLLAAAETCSTPEGSGMCLSTSSCSGTSVPGYCSGGNDIQCCVQQSDGACSTPEGSGECKSTTSCDGTSIPGYCSGGNDIQCCVEKNGLFGVDICDPASKSTYDCFAESGFGDMVIPRGYHSTGSVDTNICDNLKNAQQAGIPYRDTYMFPCPTCSSSASAQLSSLVSYLNTTCDSGVWSGRVWLDIEGEQYWMSSSSNQKWYEELVDSCSSNGIRCGVYSSSSQWESIFGSKSYSYGADMPLWYAHYDNSPSFSDYSSFGGWSEPYAKQYAGDTTLCSGFDVDKNYAPKWD